ncbi:hypothetical protein [Adhaeribacter aerolatus]|uniref:hypothetical protein n=1 Tax=Adhaeribacter aerolatus TaxID=670289 RepID=UPI001FE8B68A|nr:hypothetical protein [Adhaeribacter aerolatus]
MMAEHPEEHKKSAEHHQIAADHLEQAAKNHRAAAEHLAAGDHQKAAHHGYTAYGLSSHAQYHAQQAALHHSHEHKTDEPLHAHEQPGK